MTKTVREFAIDPFSVMRHAIFLFKSKKQKFLIVEGLADKRFYNQYFNSCLNIKQVEGKPNVMKAYNYWFTSNEDKTFAHFVVDVDEDFVLNSKLIVKPNLNYHVWDSTRQDGYNDLECFLIKTQAFQKVMANFDIERNDADSYLDNILDAASYIGSFRFADSIVQKQYGLKHSILDGLSILEEWFADDMTINVDIFDKDIEKRCGHKAHYAEMIDVAKERYGQKTSNIQLCRGHDITEIISILLRKKTSRRPKSEELEEKLRLACERTYLEGTPFTSFTFWNLLNNIQENV